jgi:CRP-like cAMP-binding protein
MLQTRATTLRIVKPKPTFDVDGFLRSGGAGTRVVAYQPSEIIFSQGDASDSVRYLQAGAVKLSVSSRGSHEAVVAMLETLPSSGSVHWWAIPFAAKPGRTCRNTPVEDWVNARLKPATTETVHRPTTAS